MGEIVCDDIKIFSILDCYDVLFFSQATLVQRYARFFLNLEKNSFGTYAMQKNELKYNDTLFNDSKSYIRFRDKIFDTDLNETDAFKLFDLKSEDFLEKIFSEINQRLTENSTLYLFVLGQGTPDGISFRESETNFKIVSYPRFLKNIFSLKAKKIRIFSGVCYGGFLCQTLDFYENIFQKNDEYYRVLSNIDNINDFIQYYLKVNKMPSELIITLFSKGKSIQSIFDFIKDSSSAYYLPSLEFLIKYAYSDNSINKIEEANLQKFIPFLFYNDDFLDYTKIKSVLKDSNFTFELVKRHIEPTKFISLIFKLFFIQFIKQMQKYFITERGYKTFSFDAIKTFLEIVYFLSSMLLL